MGFTENLQAILKARYGKDVRQSIHDGIKTCMDTVDAGLEECDKRLSDAEKEHTATLNNGLKEYDKKLNDALAEYDNRLSIGIQTQQSVDFQAEQGSYWYVNSNRTITKYGPSSEYSAYTNTVIPVTEGEVYEVHCAKKVADSYYVPGPVIAVSSATNSAADGTIAIFENPTDGNDQYVLTVPAGAKYLLVNHVVKDYSGIDMEIYKRNSLEDVVGKIIEPVTESQKKLNAAMAENQKKLFDIIMPIWNVLADELSVSPINGYVWGTSSGTSIMIPATGGGQCVGIDVTPGDVYWVRTYIEADGNAYAPVMLAFGCSADYTDGNVAGYINDPYVAGTNDYFVTIPQDGIDITAMLISSDEKANGEIRVWKVNADKLNPYKSITGAAAHNATYRGKKLGNALTSEMLAGIRDGSFSDLYVGDYIETEDNIYRFMDFDYFLGCVSGVSGGKIEKHHAVLVPDRVMGISAIDNYPEATQPKETHMYANKLPEITQTLKGIFGNDNVAMMDRIIPKTANGEPTGWDWVNVGADLLTEEMVMGHGSWGEWTGFQTGVLKGQLAGFRYSHFLMCSNDDYWLRNKRSATNYALISSGGISSSDIGNQQHGVRPFFVIW